MWIILYPASDEGIADGLIQDCPVLSHFRVVCDLLFEITRSQIFPHFILIIRGKEIKILELLLPTWFLSLPP